ncbi:MAG: hypothetical protein AB1758_16265 [Candidatus Eremiobacterota bacterium]
MPRSQLPADLQVGQIFGLNVLLYDADEPGAPLGSNANEGRTAWSAWPEVMGQPRLWGRARLQDSTPRQPK